jgi:hypothetical protein
VALGYQAGANLSTGSNNIFIGANVAGAAGDANKIRINRQGTQNANYIAGIYSKSVSSSPIKYWENIADKLSAAGWSWGYCSAVTCDGWRWVVDTGF